MINYINNLLKNSVDTKENEDDDDLDHDKKYEETENKYMNIFGPICGRLSQPSRLFPEFVFK